MYVETTFRVISAGALLVAVAMLMSTGGVKAQPGASGDWLPLSFHGPQHWSYIGGNWEEDEAGVINPPTEACADRLAFYVGREYSQVEAKFDFRWNIGHCGAGFVVRAQDPSHYYLVHFPSCGQHYRAKHFWAVISKADGSGWLEILDMQMIHGVASELEAWHTARVVVEGNEIRLWVDGRPGPVVYDDSYKSGYVGLESWIYSPNIGPGSSFRNIEIRGTEVPPRPWDDALQPPQNWFNPYPVGAEAQQFPQAITRAPNGELLMPLSPGGLLRSPDNGRTWGPVESEGFPGGLIHCTSDGRLINLVVRDNHILIASSEDNGKTWSELDDRAEMVTPDGVATLYSSINPLMELADGTLVLFVYSRHGSTSGSSVLEWGSVHCVAYSMRSTDGGQTWTGPTTLDGPPGAGLNLDLTEPYATQLSDGRLLCLIRPIYSPWMWETWSDNNGESWGPTTRGPFPSYACAMLPHATASGALVIGGRMPGLGLHVSHDNGMSWKHYRIDTTIWSMGSMYEVEPDVLLWVQMGEYSPNLHARGQFIRVTPDGLEPARDMLPSVENSTEAE